MKLSDVMSAANLAMYAEVGLCLFLLVFLAVVVRTFRRGSQAEFDELRRLPLGRDEE